MRSVTENNLLEWTSCKLRVEIWVLVLNLGDFTYNFFPSEKDCPHL